jgi:hypothetical protein
MPLGRSATEPEQNEFPQALSFYERFQGKFLMIRSEKVRVRCQYVDLTFPMNFWHKATILVFSESFSFFHTFTLPDIIPPFRYLHNQGSVGPLVYSTPST